MSPAPQKRRQPEKQLTPDQKVERIKATWSQTPAQKLVDLETPPAQAQASLYSRTLVESALWFPQKLVDPEPAQALWFPQKLEELEIFQESAQVSRLQPSRTLEPQQEHRDSLEDKYLSRRNAIIIDMNPKFHSEILKKSDIFEKFVRFFSSCKYKIDTFQKSKKYVVKDINPFLEFAGHIIDLKGESTRPPKLSRSDAIIQKIEKLANSNTFSFLTIGHQNDTAIISILETNTDKTFVFNKQFDFPKGVFQDGFFPPYEKLLETEENISKITEICEILSRSKFVVIASNVQIFTIIRKTAEFSPIFNNLYEELKKSCFVQMRSQNYSFSNSKLNYHFEEDESYSRTSHDMPKNIYKNVERITLLSELYFDIFQKSSEFFFTQEMLTIDATIEILTKDRVIENPLNTLILHEAVYQNTLKLKKYSIVSNINGDIK